MSDTISRADAIDAIRTRFENAREWYKEAKDEDIRIRAEATIMAFTECSLMLKKLPSAERKGKWIRHTRVEPVYSIDGVETWGIKCQCNKCCFTTTVVEDFGYYKYCPNCGARMVR